MRSLWMYSYFEEFDVGNKFRNSNQVTIYTPNTSTTFATEYAPSEKTRDLM